MQVSEWMVTGKEGCLSAPSLFLSPALFCMAVYASVGGTERTTLSPQWDSDAELLWWGLCGKRLYTLTHRVDLTSPCFGFWNLAHLVLCQDYRRLPPPCKTCMLISDLTLSSSVRLILLFIYAYVYTHGWSAGECQKRMLELELKSQAQHGCWFSPAYLFTTKYTLKKTFWRD